MPWLIGDRTTRLAFVSGGRGTGKTTALLSLAKATVEAEPQSHDGVIGQKLSPVRDRLVWLEPLDLEACPESVNVIAAILTRVEAAIDVNDDPATSASLMSHAVSDHRSGVHEALGELRRVLSNVAIAWDGNLEVHKPSIDPDQYAVEVRRTEMARLKLNPSLEKLLDQLAGERLWGPAIRNPLFVLPVDDFDLSPSLNLALLHLLRLISVPRLFVVIMGDIRITEKVVELKLGGNFARVSAPVGDRVLARQASEIAGLVGEVASNAMTKLLPRSQRITLQRMSVAEALRFRPLGLPPTQEPQRLHDLLDKVHLATPERTVLKLLLSEVYNTFKYTPGYQEGDALRKLLGRDAYFGLEALRTTPRRLTDLWIRLAPRSDDDDTDDTTQPIARLRDSLLATIAESPSLTAAQRSALRAATSEGPDGGIPIMGVTAHARLRRSRDSMRLVAKKPSLPTSTGASASFELGAGHDWELTAHPHDDVARPPYLDPETAASIVLLHDLAVLSEDEPARQEALDNVSIDFDSGSLARTMWTLRDGAQVRLSWPAPPATTFVDFDRFAHQWRRFVQRTSPELELKEVMRQWIRIGLSLLSEPTSDRDGDWATVFQGLEGSAKRLGQQSASERDPPRRYDTSRWLRGIATMLMPEVGIDRDLYHELIGFTPQCRSLVKFWTSNAAAIRRKRALHVVHLTEAGLHSAWSFVELPEPPQEAPADAREVLADLNKALRIRDVDRRVARTIHAARRAEQSRQPQRDPTADA